MVQDFSPELTAPVMDFLGVPAGTPTLNLLDALVAARFGMDIDTLQTALALIQSEQA